MKGIDMSAYSFESAKVAKEKMRHRICETIGNFADEFDFRNGNTINFLSMPATEARQEKMLKATLCDKGLTPVHDFTMIGVEYNPQYPEVYALAKRNECKWLTIHNKMFDFVWHENSDTVNVAYADYCQSVLQHKGGKGADRAESQTRILRHWLNKGMQGLLFCTFKHMPRPSTFEDVARRLGYPDRNEKELAPIFLNYLAQRFKGEKVSVVWYTHYSNKKMLNGEEDDRSKMWLFAISVNTNMSGAKPVDEFDAVTAFRRKKMLADLANARAARKLKMNVSKMPNNQLEVLNNYQTYGWEAVEAYFKKTAFHVSCLFGQKADIFVVSDVVVANRPKQQDETESEYFKVIRRMVSHIYRFRSYVNNSKVSGCLVHHLKRYGNAK